MPEIWNQRIQKEFKLLENVEITLFFLPTQDFVDFQYVPDRVNMKGFFFPFLYFCMCMYTINLKTFKKEKLNLH